MDKQRVFALILLGVTVIVLLLTRGKADVNLIVTTIDSARASFVYLGFMVTGVVIGLFLK